MSLLERVRELGMLRAIGMSRGQLTRMVLAEAVLLGVLGGTAAAALGAYLGKLWVVSSVASSLGWYVRVHLPWTSMATTVATGLLVGVVVGLLCTRRVASLEIRSALETA
jgi:putative ABC transport system permease protein